MPAPKSVFITASNRGIGLGLVHAFVERTEIEHIFCTARNPEAAKDLLAIKDSRLHVLKMSVDCDDSIKEACHKVESIVGASGLEMLVCNAGVSGDYDFSRVDRQKARDVMEVNYTSVLAVNQIFHPLLMAAAAKGGACSVTVSSMFASCTMQFPIDTLPFVNYKASKAAVNMLVVEMGKAFGQRGLVSVAVCPGSVKTDMNPNGVITVADSASHLVAFFCSIGKEHNSGYFDRFGKPIER